MESLLNELVSNLTGLESNDLEYRKICNKAKHTLKYAKCLSTSEKEVNDSLDGLAEKFAIKGRHELSDALIRSKQELLNPLVILGSLDSNQSILKYDMIKLLLCLSTAMPSRYMISERTDALKQTEVTWDDIVRDEPLDGDHWKSWSEDDDSADRISDEEAFEVEQNPLKAMDCKSRAEQAENENDINQKTTYINFFDRMEVDGRGETDVLNHLAMQQYWGSDFSFARAEYSFNRSLLHSPYSLNIIQSEPIREQQVVKEADMIREVLFLLRGHSGILFEYNEHDLGFFLKNENFIVQHLSQGALSLLLIDFCNHATTLSRLRNLVSRILLDTMQYGQAAQAFATVIYKSLSDFEGQISVFETDNRFITKDPLQTISLLKLQNELQSQLQCFRELYDVVEHIPFEKDSPRSITFRLLSALYERALDRQLSGQYSLYNTLLYVFQKTAVPFGQLMDDWVFRGSLEGDRLKEFYVTRNEEISMKNSNFWTQGFSLQKPSETTDGFHCPLFEKRFVERIFFTGKAVNLLLKIEKIKDEEVCIDQIPALFCSFFQKFLPSKCPFINTPSSEAKKNIGETYNLFIKSLFPMANISRVPTLENTFKEDYNEDVYLFDQSLVQCMEHYIQKPYSNIAQKLNTILHNNCGLLAQLELLSQVYLMLENDLMSNFCQNVFVQMDNKENWFDKRSLNNTFTESCKSNEYDSSDFVEIEVAHLKNRFNTNNTYTIPSALQCIRFNMSISWPLNNFIQDDILKQYSEISKLLLCLRRAKHTLEKKICYNSQWRYQDDNPEFARFYSIRIKILWFVNTLFQYIMVAVLHAETIKFRKSLYNSTDVDDIIVFHAAYIQGIMEKCMLDEKSTSIRIAVFKIFNIAENLADVFSKYIYTEKTIMKNAYQRYNPEDFDYDMDIVESEFKSTSQFVLNGLIALSKESGLLWCESLVMSFRAEHPTEK